MQKFIQVNNSTPVTTTVLKKKVEKSKHTRVLSTCPECGAHLLFAEASFYCAYCGYSQYDGFLYLEPKFK